MSHRPAYPEWICSECGAKWGMRPAGRCTIHQDTCGMCGEERMVTEPRDYGHLKEGWEAGVTFQTKVGD